MKLDTLRIRQTKLHATASKSTYAPAPVRAGQAASRGPLPVAEKHKFTEDDKRRSQRVLLRVRANIFVAINGKPTAFEVITLSVNHHGALVVMDQSLPPETRLVLEHGGTRERIACKVARASREMPGGFQVPIEFDSPSPDFWRISFPASDWRADEV